MKRISTILTAAAIAAALILAAGSGPGTACVGRTLYIGSTGTVEESLMAEMMVTLINERTGTTVKLREFPSAGAMYKALKSDDENTRADIIIENTVQGLRRIKAAPSGDPEKDYETVKQGYEKNNDLDLIWMPPFGYHVDVDGKKALSAAVIRRNVLTNFPLLPRVLKKLSHAIDDRQFSKMTAKVKKGEKARNVGKDFLLRKKII